MRGLIDTACRMRDLANSSGHREALLQSANDVLDRLYYEDRAIDWRAWRDLQALLHDAE